MIQKNLLQYFTNGIEGLISKHRGKLAIKSAKALRFTTNPLQLSITYYY
jgi:hypothetical protein